MFYFFIRFDDTKMNFLFLTAVSDLIFWHFEWGKIRQCFKIQILPSHRTPHEPLRFTAPVGLSWKALPAARPRPPRLFLCVFIQQRCRICGFRKCVHQWVFHQISKGWFCRLAFIFQDSPTAMSLASNTLQYPDFLRFLRFQKIVK